MAQNLYSTHYQNNDPIDFILSVNEWGELVTGAYCYFDSDPISLEQYGNLYNWHAVNDDRGVCPENWHIPTYDEWQQLIQNLGGVAIAGGKLKEEGTSHWYPPNLEASNESGFTGLPGGYRFLGNNEFYWLGIEGYFWSSTLNSTNYAWAMQLYYHSATAFMIGDHVNQGFSIRCIQD